ncbi:MAG: Rpn family recombination-promoting nuclease/putative transposase [Eubacteriales bacterium]|nr:Rpn family recombination-promoting nuclease/putative transposase [Eubacteriales bacterium]
MEEEKSISVIRKKEHLVEEARKFNLLSNVFMSVALDDKAACQHVIRILTGIPDLVVKEVRSQYRISKVTSHDAVLDILAEDGKGRLHNLEIQRKDTVDHARRSRFYAAMIDSEYLMKGQEYSDLPEVYMIYISETDLWKAGRTVYEAQKAFKDTDILYEDGVHIIYVNAAVDDGSEIAKLMNYFKTADPADQSQGDLSKRIHLMKCEEGGYDLMCEVSERIYNEGKIEGKIEGKREGKLEGKRETALNLAEMGMPVESIAKAVKEGVGLVQQWISGANAARQ